MAGRWGPSSRFDRHSWGLASYTFSELNQHSAHILLEVHNKFQKTKLDQMVFTTRLSQGEPSLEAEAQVLDGELGSHRFRFNWGTWPPGVLTVCSVTQASGSPKLLSPPSVSDGPAEMADTTT